MKNEKDDENKKTKVLKLGVVKREQMHIQDSMMMVGRIWGNVGTAPTYFHLVTYSC